jgi:hypothetical protein
MVIQRRVPSTAEVTRAVAPLQRDSARYYLFSLLFNAVRDPRLVKPGGAGAYESSREGAIEALSAIYPENGEFNEKAYSDLIAANQDIAYQEVLPPHQAIKADDRLKLSNALKEARFLAGQLGSNETPQVSRMLVAVFGPDYVAHVRGVFKSIASRLRAFGVDNFVTDYNQDNLFMCSAGATAPHSAAIELTRTVLLGTDHGLVATIIHEASHEVDDTIVDRGYRKSSGFERMGPKNKITNAGHYEEASLRLLGKSDYGEKVFSSKAGATEPDAFVKKIKLVNDGMEQLWIFAANMQSHARRQATGGTSLMNSDLITKIRTAFDLPHREDPRVTGLDLALMESYVKKLALARGKLKSLGGANEDTRQKWGDRTTDQIVLKGLGLVGGLTPYEDRNQSVYHSLLQLYSEFMGSTPFKD